MYICTLCGASDFVRYSKDDFYFSEFANFKYYVETTHSIKTIDVRDCTGSVYLGELL